MIDKRLHARAALAQHKRVPRRVDELYAARRKAIIRALELGVTQAEIGRLLGVSRSLVNREIRQAKGEK